MVICNSYCNEQVSARSIVRAGSALASQFDDLSVRYPRRNGYSQILTIYGYCAFMSRCGFPERDL
jgi:hypothetical protein